MSNIEGWSPSALNCPVKKTFLLTEIQVNFHSDLASEETALRQPMKTCFSLVTCTTWS